MKTFQLNGRVCSTAQIREIARLSQGEEYILITLRDNIRWIHFGEERLLQVARDTDAAMAYADRFNPEQAPVIDYQLGALRDDFDFGSVMMWRVDCLQQAVAEMDTDYQFAGLYDLRLRVSRLGQLVHIPEFLYYEVETDLRKSGEKLFDYVDPKNRAVQIEMEQCVTAHLKALGGYLQPHFKDVDLDEGDFPVEATVVIPCRNRVRTIGDAIRSALRQVVHAPYSYNVIVVDDNSVDGTLEVIRQCLKENAEQRKADPHAPELIHIAQDKTWHAIGGNWNAALHHDKCGRFALQLDSDDTYSDEHTVQRFIDAFRTQRCAMVVGTYRMTDIDGNILPPGIIDHREWTEDNGRNNALRINGLGAPRGFLTSLLRQLNFPTTKYGEDYAVGLRVSREYKIGRIYDVLYNCRRWEDNSDANCDIVAMNRNNWYKDRLRTWELEARIRLNAAKRGQ